MIDQRCFPFGGVPVYNPQSLSKEEALAQFHVRQSAYEHLLALLHQERPPHVLIIGAPGMGKTTLIQRLRYGVEDNPELNQRYLVLVFPEEQYNVNRLDRFLLNTVDALADAMERLQDRPVLSRVEAYAVSMGKRTPGEIEEQVPQFLAEFGNQAHRGFLLLVDNADRLFDIIEGRQQWRLRELLSTRRDLTLVGATTQASDGIYGSDRAFFEFFQIQTLPPLTYVEVRDLLLRLSESVEEKEGEKGTAKRRVAEWLDSDPARLHTLVQLTGGNPRTTVLLFHLVLDGLQGGAREYLEQLLDQVTPNYKGRVDELPPQAQQVLDAVALHWDPVTAMEVASESGLETAVVSTQLTRLARQGILEKADPGDSKKALYQVAERFFNIWYLMRASRRVRAKLRWFVEFLRVFFDNGELERIAWDRIERYRPTWRSDPSEVETAFAYVLASGARRDRLEEYLRHNCSDTEEVWRPYLDLIEHVSNQKVRPLPKESGNTEVEIRALIESEPQNSEHWSRLGDFLRQDLDRTAEAEAAFREAIDISPKSAAAWAGLARLLTKSANRHGEAESFIRTAIELEPIGARHWRDLGDILAQRVDGVAEAEAAYRKAIELAPERDVTWHRLAVLLANIPERVTEAEVAYRRAIELDPEWAGYWGGLATLLARVPERAAEAEVAYRKAIELDPKSHRHWHGLARLLIDTVRHIKEAEVACRKAVEFGSESACAWWDLGRVLAKIPKRSAEAEAAYRKAIELDPKWASPRNGLANLLQKTPDRVAEAEAAHRKAIELDPQSHSCWHDLGGFLAKTPSRMVEAETALCKANELYPKCVGCWFGLATLLSNWPERAAEAEAAYRKVIELEPTRASGWYELAELLQNIPERAVEAEAAYRKAVELKPKLARAWVRLATLLDSRPERRDEAENAYRKAVELEPKLAENWCALGAFLKKTQSRVKEAEAAYYKATEVNPADARSWKSLGLFLACNAHNPIDAEIAFRTAIRLQPDEAGTIRNFGVLLWCELGDLASGSDYLERAHRLNPEDPVTTAIAAAAKRGMNSSADLKFPINAARFVGFWNELLGLCRNYPPFGRLLLVICELVQEFEPSNLFVKLFRAVALGQLQEFPRASVAFEDALTDDPIELLKNGQQAIETVLAAAVKSGRLRDLVEVLDRKAWKDAWRPIYEALRAAETGSAEYLKRIAVEIRTPALEILRRIAPDSRDMPGRTR